MKKMKESIKKDLEVLNNKHREANNTITETKNTLEGINGEGNGNPLQVLLSGRSHGQRSLVGCSPWVAKSPT